MAHEISIRENGMAEMAFIGDRSAIWHGLGQALPEDQSIDEWKVAAGMDWDVFSSVPEFQYVDAMGKQQTGYFRDKQALFRSDTKEPLSIVGHKYKVVQPGEVLEFFRDLTEENDMKLSTAGVLFGGRRFWALAEVGESFKLNGVDEVRSNLLLTTSVDGTLATTAKFVSTRVVCNNTLSVAMSKGEAGQIVKVTHRSDFDPSAVKIDLGLFESKWDEFMSNIKHMAETKVSDKIAHNFFTEMATDKKKTSRLKVERLEELYKNGTGASMSHGTAWGLLNAVTELYTHGSNETSGDNSNKFLSAYAGPWDKEKSKAYDKVLELVEA